MNIKKTLTHLALVIPMLSGAQYTDHITGWRSYYSNEKGDVGFTTLQLIKNNMRQMIPCIEYTIHGISTRMYFTKLGVPITYLTLNVSHNSPDNLYMTHYQLDDIPFIEFNTAFGSLYKTASEKILQVPTSLLIGSAAYGKGIEASKYYHENYDEYQSLNLYESTVIGNPSAIIFQMFDQNGLKPANRKDGTKHSPPTPCQTPGCLEDYYKDFRINPSEIVGGWASGSFGSTLNLTDALKAIAGSEGTLTELTRMVSSIKLKINDLVAKFGPLKLGGSLFCPSAARPFEPMYLSGIDAHGWRWGYPLTDAEHSATVLNPLSGDTVGGNFIVPPTQWSQSQTFGHIYPREGTVNNPQTAKAAMVIAKRSESLLTSPSPYRIIPGKNSFTGTGAWSRTFPQINQTSCRKNIAYTGLKEHTQAKHAWTQWPKYRCDLVRRGFRIAYIPVGPFRITSKITD